MLSAPVSAARRALFAGTVWLVTLSFAGAPASASSAGQPGPSVKGAAGAPRSFGAPLPGAPPFDDGLIRRLDAAWASRDPHYKPRTRHLRPDGLPQYTNRLFLQSSPYLLQHAHNPVNWYPWGDEAFETARKLGRPIFLSVGYSTCHWCHVMEEESFEDEEIARYLNENYIAIKVDREERPDLDAVYMEVVQIAERRWWLAHEPVAQPGAQAVLRRDLRPGARRRPGRSSGAVDSVAQAQGDL